MDMQLTESPAYQKITAKDVLSGLISPVKIILDNSLPVFLLKAENTEILKLDIVFKGGAWYQDKPLVSYFTRKILPEGTSRKSSLQIARIFDFAGASFDISGNYEFMTMSLFCLHKHFEKMLRLIHEIIFEPSFPQKEFHLQKDSKIKEIIIDEQKVRMIAMKHIRRMIFGQEHPYGHYVNTRDVEEVTLEDVKAFYGSFIRPGEMKIILSGNIADAEINSLNRVFGNCPVTNNEDLDKKRYEVTTNTEKKQFFPVDNALQSAIRIGRQVISNQHADYPALIVLNTILGGYFGSRLMKNLREDKGYTYGVSSFLVPDKQGVFFTVGSEVKAAFTVPALTEIYREMNKLTSESVQKEEMERVKNYIFGKYMRLSDGVFAQSELLIDLMKYGSDFSFYEKQLKGIAETGQDKILELARTYFVQDEICEAVAGSRQ